MICIYEATFYVNQFHKDIVLLKTIAINITVAVFIINPIKTIRFLLTLVRVWHELIKR